jgi:hypothetical protein
MRSLAAIVACTFALAACEGPDAQLDAHGLKLAAHRFASLSAEAAVLAGQLADRRVTDGYASVHQQALGAESLALSGELAKPVPAATRQAHDALALLNARFQSDVSRLAQAAGQPDELARLRKSFEDLRDAAQSLEGSR